MSQIRGQLFRENKGWVLVTPEDWASDDILRVQEYWAKVSDLPIVVFLNTELLFDSEGKIVVKQVAFETEPVKEPTPISKARKKKASDGNQD